MLKDLKLTIRIKTPDPELLQEVKEKLKDIPSPDGGVEWSSPMVIGFILGAAYHDMVKKKLRKTLPPWLWAAYHCEE